MGSNFERSNRGQENSIRFHYVIVSGNGNNSKENSIVLPVNSPKCHSGEPVYMAYSKGNTIMLGLYFQGDCELLYEIKTGRRGGAGYIKHELARYNRIMPYERYHNSFSKFVYFHEFFIERHRPVIRMPRGIITFVNDSLFAVRLGETKVIISNDISN